MPRKAKPICIFVLRGVRLLEKMEEEASSSSKSPDSPDTQTIVITPSELQKMGLAKDLKCVIEAQTQKAEIGRPATTKIVDKRASIIDPKTMKSKLCTLLNHTPLVMQVKDIEWMPPERKSPILLNNISKIPITVQPAVSTSISHTNIPIVVEDDNEPKPKLKIVSNEKLNISASEIENMLNKGKLLKSNQKISSPLQKHNAEAKLDLETEKNKCVFIDSSKEPSASLTTSINVSSTIASEAVSTIAPVTTCKEPPTAETKQITPVNPGVLKKECLKRIQAKMYENLKKVLEEVESRPVKNKASFDIKPLTTAVEDVVIVSKPLISPKPVEKSKENKPCYMNKYRERKLLQETRESVNRNDDVIEIDSKPSSPGSGVQYPVLNIVDENDIEEDVQILTKPESSHQELEESLNEDDQEHQAESSMTKYIPKKRGRPRKQPIPHNDLEQSDPKKEDRKPQAGSPLKKYIVKRFSECENQIAVSYKENPTTSNEQKIPKRRGRPPKRKIVDENDTETEKEHDATSDNESKEIQKDTTVIVTPTPKRRGRPPKNRPVVLPKNILEIISNKKREENVKGPSNIINQQTEHKIPKKRGRKSKAELEAIRSSNENPTQGYTQSKTSGRKRKKINYSLLNGEDSDVDEPEIKVAKVEVAGKKRAKYSYKSVRDEYGSSPSDKNETEKIDESASEDEKITNIVATVEIEDAEEEKHEEDDAETNLDQVECTVCEKKLNKKAWPEHKRRVHNDLAWNSSEEPLNLDDTSIVVEILNSVLREEGVLKCSICENKSDTAEHFVEHKKDCNTNLNLSARPKKKFKTRKPGGVADIMDSLLLNFSVKTPVLEERSESDNEKPTDYVVSKDHVQCEVCFEIMQRSQWYPHNQNRHNNLAWRTCDRPLNLNDRPLVIKILSELCHKRKFLRCEICGENRRSVVGFISHRSRCEKSVDEIDDLKVECSLCKRKMLPVSLPRHMALTHERESAETIKLKDVGNEPVVLGSKRKAAYKATEIIQNYINDNPNENKKYFKGVRFRSKDEVITKFNEDIRNLGVASCVYENCNYSATDAEDLFQHLDTCSAKGVKEYTCNFCLATYKTRISVRKHINETHSSGTQEDLIIQNLSSEEEEFQEDEDQDEDTKNSKIECKMSPYMKIEKVHYEKIHPKFLGPLVKKPIRHYYHNAYKWTLDYYKGKCSVENIFPDIIPSKNSWKALDKSKICNYLPKWKQSMDFTRIEVESVTNPTNPESDWVKYKLFQSSINTDGSTIIFCGGPITAMSWAPTPYNLATEDQILAICVISDPYKQYLPCRKYTDKGLIQFWNYGPLHNKTVPTYVPKLEFCIAHTHGPIWCMEWCPSGCYDTNQSESLRKLGLLAVACSDSCVYIYTILRPDQILGKIFDIDPTFKLITEDESDINLGELPCHPTKLSWTKASGHSYLAVGFSNGIISIFKINTENGLLKRKVKDVFVLKPIISFKAHSEAITALVLHHLEDGKRWLISGSVDKESKLWDLKDVSEPVNNLKKYIVTDAVWNMHWHSAVFSYNHHVQISAVATSLIPARNYNGAASPFVPSNSATTSISSSDWGNLFVQVNETGEVLCSFPDQLLYAFENERRIGLRKSRLIASYTGCIPKNLTAEEREERENTKLDIMKHMYSSKKVIGDEPLTYEEAANTYGLVLCDVKTDRYTSNPSQEFRKLVSTVPFHSVAKPDMYPLQSINKVVLNPNKHSFLFYACGYQVGLVRTFMLRYISNR
ncbi:hypothetical protein Trydic_g22289 [Trypoxylus dichotomus]